MKKLFVLLPTLLLPLSACSPQQPAGASPAPPAVSTPAAPVSPMPSPQPDSGPLWWEDISFSDLPSACSEPEDISAGSGGIYLLASLPEQELSLYGYGGEMDGAPCGILIGQGTGLSPFDQVYLSAESPALPELWWNDFDGDGSGELAVKYLLANGASSLVYELHIYEPQPDGGWTDHSLTEREIDALLSAAVEYRFDAAAGIATASVPGEDASYRLGDQDPNPVADYALSFTGRTFYRYEDGSFTGVFGAGLCLQGLETLQYFATVTADVVYDGNGFSLEHLRLMEIGGV